MTTINNHITDLFDKLIFKGSSSVAILVDGPTIYYTNGISEPVGGPIDREEFIADMDALGIDVRKSRMFTYFHHTPNEFVHKLSIDITAEKSRLDPQKDQLTVYVRHKMTMLKTELEQELVA